MGIEEKIEVILNKVSSLEELIQDLRIPQKSAELPDRCGIDEACKILGSEEKPASKAIIYKLTSDKSLPHAKFNGKLVFSRRQLVAWVDSHTVSPTAAEDEIKANLVRSAKKHLRNAK